MTERVSYPVNYELANVQATEEEEQYDVNIEERVLQGEVHPRFVRWFNEDPNNPEPVSNGSVSKIRYRTCKLCPQFDPSLKLCEKCNCFMPIKVQFKMFNCPLGKWEE